MEENKCSFGKAVKDEELFYGVVRWLVLVAGVAALVILVFIPVVSYLRSPNDKDGISRLVNFVISAMGIASLLLAVHSATETRGSNKEIHEFTSQLEKITFRQEQNVTRTMDKLEELSKNQQQMNSMLEGGTTTSKNMSGKLESRPWGADSPSVPGTADPAELTKPAEPTEPAEPAEPAEKK